MAEPTYFFILLFMGFMFVSPAFSIQKEQVSIHQINVTKKQAEELFEDLLGNNFNVEESIIPKEVKIMDIRVENSSLYLNISKDIKNYGGTLTEQWIVYQILDTGFAISGVENITVLIEGQEDYLPEGTIIKSYSKEEWLEERMKERE